MDLKDSTLSEESQTQKALHKKDASIYMKLKRIENRSVVVRGWEWRNGMNWNGHKESLENRLLHILLTVGVIRLHTITKSHQTVYINRHILGHISASLKNKTKLICSLHYRPVLRIKSHWLYYPQACFSTLTTQPPRPRDCLPGQLNLDATPEKPSLKYQHFPNCMTLNSFSNINPLHKTTVLCP